MEEGNWGNVILIFVFICFIGIIFLSEVFRSKNRKIKMRDGFILVIIGLAIYLWASSHSPDPGYAETYFIKRPFYNVFIICAVVFGIGGIVSIIQGVISGNTLTIQSQPSFCSQCGTRVLQDDEFCSECGTRASGR